MAELDNMRAVSQARQAEERRLAERRRNTLVLIMRHLVDAGYVESYERLSAECNVSLQKARATRARTNSATQRSLPRAVRDTRTGARCSQLSLPRGTQLGRSVPSLCLAAGPAGGRGRQHRPAARGPGV